MVELKVKRFRFHNGNLKDGNFSLKEQRQLEWYNWTNITLSATPPVQRKYVGNGLKMYFAAHKIVSGFNEREIHNYWYPNPYSGLGYEHRFDLQINLHYTVEPWHENTCTYSEKSEFLSVCPTSQLYPSYITNQKTEW